MRGMQFLQHICGRPDELQGTHAHFLFDLRPENEKKSTVM